MRCATFSASILLFVVGLGLCQSQKTNLTPRQLYQMVSPAVVLIEMYDEKGEAFKRGSGFIVSSDGRIVTNYHIVSHSKRGTVKLPTGDIYDLKDVVDVDKRRDIAVVKVRAVELPKVPIGRSAAVEIGQKVYVISNPLAARGKCRPTQSIGM